MSSQSASPVALTIDHAAKERREDARYRKGQYANENTTCFCCGRKAGSHWVAIDLRNDSAVNVEYAQSDEFDSAFFPVGPTCRKAFGIPKTHVITRAKLFPNN